MYKYVNRLSILVQLPENENADAVASASASGKIDGILGCEGVDSFQLDVVSVSENAAAVNVKAAAVSENGVFVPYDGYREPIIALDLKHLDNSLDLVRRF